MPEEKPQGLKIVAKFTHPAFYGLLIAMLISGALAWVAGFELPAEAHEVAAKVMMALIVLHVAGGLVQQFVPKSGAMLRMSPKQMLQGSTGKGPLQ